MNNTALRQLAAPAAHNPLGPIRIQIIERTYMASLVPGCPPVLVKTVEGKLQSF